MRIQRAAEKVAELFREMDLDELSELSVAVDAATSLADSLRAMGFEVTVQPRFADAERTEIARYALNVKCGTFDKYGQNTDR